MRLAHTVPPAVQIVAITVCSAILYGILHDEVTAHVCVEYFTVAHPYIIESDDPTLLGLFWGIVATWWIALIMSFILAYAARHGDKPKISVGLVGRQVALLFIGAAVSAATMGIIAASVASTFHLSVPDNRIAPSKQIAFIGVWAAHLTLLEQFT